MAESMVGLKRSHRCTEVTSAQIGEKVTVMGWVQKSRNKGGIIFVDLRDRSGILQIIFEENDCGTENFEKAEKLRSEFVIAVEGRVEARSGAVNENLATGAIEVRAESLRILAESETPPFPIEEKSKTKEDLRLEYRFLDLRRPDIQRNLMLRSRVATLTRAFLAEEGFLEIETPTLIKSTPEGARDYLVPSRVHPGSFYALPQSPQLFKQLLMVSGYDRYSAFTVIPDLSSVTYEVGTLTNTTDARGAFSGTEVQGVKVSYSSDKHSSLDEHAGDWMGESGNMNWQDTPTSEIVNLRFQFPSTFEVDKGQTVCITFKGTIPDYVQNTGEENIAWNSFAYSYQYLNDKNELVETPMVAEPAKVGVWVPEVKDTVSLVVNKAYDSGQGDTQTFYFALFTAKTSTAAPVPSGRALVRQRLWCSS